MSQTSATLGGITLRGANSYDWELRNGTSPVERFWTITAKHVEKFKPLLGTPCVLEIKGPRKTLRVEHVYPLEILPGRNPHEKVLRVADRRWLWSRAWVSFSCNVRMASGTSFLTNDSGLIENAVLQPQIRYRKGSLYPISNPTEPWTPKRVLETVFESEGFLNTPVSSFGNFETFEVQDLVFEDPGPAAADRALAFFAGADVYIDYDGRAIVHDTLQSGRAVLPRLGRKQVTGGDVELVSRPELAPSKYVILFTNEVEVRFEVGDSRIGGTGDLPAGPAQNLADSESLFNVAPSPDPTITLTNGRTVARGSPVDHQTLFTTWGAFGALETELSNSFIAKRGMASGLLEQIYANNPTEPFSAINAARIRAIVQTWRRLYRIDETFLGRLESVRPVRASILNTETGTRAPSKAYCDYVRKPATAGFARNMGDPNKQAGWAVRGWATRLEDGHVLPGQVRVLDPGLVEIVPELDPWSEANAIMLGYPANGFVPSQAGEADANRTGEDAYAQWVAGPLEEQFRLATVLTVVPATPNDNRRFHQVEILASQIGVEGTGPPMYVRVFPGVMTARFAWSDNEGNAIISAIKGFGNYPSTLLVNREDVAHVALAAAKRAGDVFAPRLSGSVDVDLDPELRPTGPIGSVAHVLNGGVMVTRATVTSVRSPVDIWPYLPAATRRVVMRVLNEGGGLT